MGNSEARVKRGKTLSDGDVTELSNLSGFTPQQVREWHSGFLKDCPSGRLNKKKFIEVYKQFYPTGKAEKFCEYVFRTFDTDGSGNIDFGEFLIAISITAQQDPKKKLEWAFSMYDIDRNGYIEKKEMKKIMDAIYDLLGEEKKGSNSPEIKVDQSSQKWTSTAIRSYLKTNSLPAVYRTTTYANCSPLQPLERTKRP